MVIMDTEKSKPWTGFLYQSMNGFKCGATNVRNFPLSNEHLHNVLTSDRDRGGRFGGKRKAVEKVLLSKTLVAETVS